MHDAAARRHEVQLARLDRESGAEAVAVHDLAVEEIGDGREPDVGMRSHVDTRADQELGRTHLIKEDERSDHLLARRGQRAAYGEPAEVAGARHDYLLDGIARPRIAGLGVVV
jgi:hypothetical protein